MARTVENPIIDNHKICSDCGKNIHIDRMVKNNRAKDGYANICKLCRRKRRAERYDVEYTKLEPSRKKQLKSGFGGDWLGSNSIYS